MGEISYMAGGPAGACLGAGVSRTTQGPWAILGVAVLFLAVFSIDCGLVSGDGEAEQSEDAGDAARAEIQAEVAGDNEGNPDPEVAAAAEGESSEAEVSEATEAVAPPEPEASAPAEAAAETDAAAPGLLVANEEQARNMAWAYISQCIAFASSELEATQTTGDWYV